ncbi:MAG: DUF4038 domain-containing protein [Kiritimatiellae bacterium]|nr:DUF4038 domain-containing protein [Kiritimatiellia bacterium]
MKKTEDVPLYDVLELSIKQERRPKNPFELPVRALFSDAAGARTEVCGFYDGDDTYKVRFMPGQLGRWEYVVRVGEKAVRHGAFCCTPSSLPGPLRVDSAHPNHFLFADGTPFYMLGNTAYNAIAAYRHAEDRFCRFLDYYAERRFNWNRFFLQQTTWPTLGDVVWPWGGSAASPDFAAFSLRTFRDAEGVIREMARRGMVASVILLHPFDEPFKPDVIGAEKMAVCKAYFRYAVARLGAYWNVVWNVANEWHRGHSFTYDEMDELGRCLHVLDPYERLTACHHYGRFEFHDKEWTDMSSLQERGTPFEMNRTILQNGGFGKPVLNEEYGYELDTIKPPNDPDNVRQDHWAIAMAGGYGTYGDKTKGPKIAVYFSCNLDDAVGTAVPDALRHLPAFMERTPYRHMQPGNHFVSGCNAEEVFCLAAPGREYVVYMAKGQAVTVNLTHVRGTVLAAWYNPRTGERTHAGEFVVPQSREEVPPEAVGKAGTVRITNHHHPTFAAPDQENDWVLHLRRMDSE